MSRPNSWSSSSDCLLVDDTRILVAAQLLNATPQPHVRPRLPTSRDSFSVALIASGEAGVLIQAEGWMGSPRGRCRVRVVGGEPLMTGSLCIRSRVTNMLAAWGSTSSCAWPTARVL